MTKPTMLGATFAFVALSASIAGITTGVADAKPREVNCTGIYQAMSDSADMAQAAYAQGDHAAAASWERQYWRASKNYSRYCHG
jgi:hypothetical protein